MPSGTEIYVCKPGQKLEQGRMEFVPETMDRGRAEADARERFERDDGIAKYGSKRVVCSMHRRGMQVYMLRVPLSAIHLPPMHMP